MKSFKTRHDNMHKRYRQCAETCYADSDVKDDEDLTPRITLTNDTTSVNVFPTHNISASRTIEKRKMNKLDSFTQTAWTRWRRFRSADS